MSIAVIRRLFSFRPTISIDSFLSKYSQHKFGEHSNSTENIGGRIAGIRDSSKSLMFIDIQANSQQMQAVYNTNYYKSLPLYQTHKSYIQKGNYIGITGIPFRTKMGALSILANEIQLLAKCHHKIPITNRSDKPMMVDIDTRFTNRALDFWVNKENMKYFYTRRNVIDCIRNYLNQRNYLEVETPILCTHAGGAIAKPFTTHSNELNMNFELRIAPELYLKELIVSGFERVYEIGKVFRNEGIDAMHNPEFTTCEFYQAHANYEDLMVMTEQLIRQIVTTSCNSSLINGIDFSKPFERVDVMTKLQSYFDTQIDLSSNTLAQFMEELLIKKNIIRPNERHNLKKLFDKAISVAIEEQCIQPTYILHHPKLISPLAMPCEHNPLITQRFELFINKNEYANAYSELNDPFIQQQNFAQQKQFSSIDKESAGMDQHFIDVLSYGMPPTAGCGIGIDRLCMLLCNVANIREVILFPPIRKPL